MSTQTKALKLALEALKKSDGFLYNWHENYSDDEADAYAAARQLNEQAIIAAEKALMSVSDGAQPAQEQNLKLMPREATPEMLKAMDECSTEGYDERLYEGHAGSVYMAAWDAFYGQHCYCGDITNLGVIHRDDGPCHYPEHKEPKQEQEPVAWITQGGKGWLRWHKSYDDNKDSVPLYTTPPQRTWVGLTNEDIRQLEKENTVGGYHGDYCPTWDLIEATEAKLKEKNT